MFNLEKFENSPILEKVDKLNKFLSKNKIDKIAKILNELQNLLGQENLGVPITYILSILAEKKIEVISEGLLEKIADYLNSENINIKINSLSIIGFAMLANSRYIDKYFNIFIKYLLDESEDIRNNVYFFLQELVEQNPNLVNLNINLILDGFKIERRDDNILSLLKLIDKCETLEFDHLYKFRYIISSLISAFHDKRTSQIFIKLIQIIKKVFPNLIEEDLENLAAKSIINLVENQFLMKKHNFTFINKNKGIRLKDFLKNFAKSPFKDEKIYFYSKTKENIIFVYELEKNKLLNFFNAEEKISDDEINNRFSTIIEDSSELTVFIKTLNNLKIIQGYYSDIGFFYPKTYIMSILINDLQTKGLIELNKFKFLPNKFLAEIISDISKSTDQKFLLHKDKETYSSLKIIQTNINSKAAKKSVIELKPYREKLLEEDFIKLAKRMPKEYLSKFHKGTQWLTNLGVQKIINEIQNSKIIGFFDISKISNKLNIAELLLLDVFEELVDSRSGIWDIDRNTFYYSKYLKNKINKISAIADENEKLLKINEITNELNIDKNQILVKIDENLQSIAKEIKQKDQIKIEDYLEKTGMELNTFLKFVDELGISYFKKADFLIFNPQKIEDAKNDIKYMLIDKSKSNDYISLGTYDITSNLIEDLIKDLLEDGKLKGIFYENQGEVIFYTERGIRNLMLENSYLFSFRDLFYGKELDESEIDLIREIFDELIISKRLKGSFDEDSLTFSSDDVIFAKDYNIVLFEFEKMVNNYISKFEIEFQKIKRILIKTKETIYPQEIKIIQESIDKINEKYINWRSGLEAFIRNTNKKLLRDQGISVKRYKNLLSEKKKEEIKSLEEDSEIIELQDNFNQWIKLFNRLELKYPNVIFYQKRLINNPNDLDSKRKFNELLEELNLD
ncbi:MAG: hypothetical protein ACFFEY_06915 [Candidatus Thorarchaeota archaeon]